MVSPDGEGDAALYAEVKALLAKGQREEAVAVFGKVIAQAREQRDKAGEAEALVWLAETNLGLEDAARGRAAHAAGSDAAKLLAALGDRYRQAYALQLAATGALASGLNEQSRKAATGALAIFSELGLKAEQAAMCQVVGKSYLAQNEFQQAIRRGLEAVDLFSELEAEVERASALLEVSQAYSSRVNARRSTSTEKAVSEWTQQALGMAQTARGIFAAEGDQEGEGKACLALATVLALTGQMQEAISTLEETKRVATDASDFPLLADAWWLSAQLFSFNNATFEKSVEAAQTALKLYKEAGNSEGEARCLAHLANFKGFENDVKIAKLQQEAAGQDYPLRGHGWEKGICMGHKQAWVRMEGLRSRAAANMRGGKVPGK